MLFERDRQRFMLSHGLLRLVLARYVGEAAAELQFETGAHGKPAVRRRSSSSQPIEFSLVAFPEGGEFEFEVKFFC